MGEVIVISGVPGTGKTAVARQLSEKLGFTYVNLSSVSISKGLIKGRDKGRDTLIVDEERLRKYLRGLVEEGRNLIVDSHYGEIVDDDLVRRIFVLRLNPESLLNRLKEKMYGTNKIKENLEAELVGTCTYNALALHPGKVCEIDTTGRTVKDIVAEIMEILDMRSECRVWVDWLSNEVSPEVLKLILR